MKISQQFIAGVQNPPDKQEKATQTVLEQAEVLSERWAEQGGNSGSEVTD